MMGYGGIYVYVINGNKLINNMIQVYLKMVDLAPNLPLEQEK
jgi:hypothetical protein